MIKICNYNRNQELAYRASLQPKTRKDNNYENFNADNHLANINPQVVHIIKLITQSEAHHNIRLKHVARKPTYAFVQPHSSSAHYKTNNTVKHIIINV